jgi:predicted aminopeptidase
MDSFKLNNSIPKDSQNLLELIPSIKKYSVDSLGYEPTGNFESIYNQKGRPILYVLTASEKYRLVPFLWQFPIIGKVSYKGFFDSTLASKERFKLICMGYDVSIRKVSAWSTLGWLNDPLLSSQLNREKGDFCNLLFHELFHATYFDANNVDLNENLATFIANKATLAFLSKDSLALQNYIDNQQSQNKVNKLMVEIIDSLNRFYSSTSNSIDVVRKQKMFYLIKKKIETHIENKPLKKRVIAKIDVEQNAFLIDYIQYHSQQDSLENAFNKIYKGSIKLMVQSLTDK